MGLSWAHVGESATTARCYFGQKKASGEGGGVGEGGRGAGGERRGRSRGGTPPRPPTQRGARGRGAPAPTFLHQLLVGERPARDQQHRQQHQGQDDAHHRAGAQARRVGVLAWGGGGQRGQGGPSLAIEPVHSGGGCWLASPRESAARADGQQGSVWPPLRCLGDSGDIFPRRLSIT